MRFVANYKYTVNEKVLAATGGDLFAEDVNLKVIPDGGAPGRGFDSDCSKTMVGFLYEEATKMTQHHVQCYYGVMVKPKSDKKTLKDNLKEVTLEPKEEESDKKEDAAPVNDSLIGIEEEEDDKTNLFLFENYMMPATSRKQTAHTEFEPNEHNDLLIETINGLDLSWKADSCMMTKDKRGKHCDGPVSLAQTESKRGK